MALPTSVPAGGGSLSGFVLSLMGITEGGYRYTEDLLALESQQADGLPQLSLLPQLLSHHCYRPYICILRKPRATFPIHNHVHIVVLVSMVYGMGVPKKVVYSSGQ